MTNQSIQVDHYGDGLSIIISCESFPAHVWLSYLSYYSIRENLPDARVVVTCARPKDGTGVEGFPWTFRTKTPFFFYKNDNNNQFTQATIAKSRGLVGDKILVISCETAVLRCLDDKILEAFTSPLTDGNSIILEAKSEVLATFCSVKEGCGRFLLPSWIHKPGHPLGLCDRFAKGNLTANERRVFNLWRKAKPLLDLIG